MEWVTINFTRSNQDHTLVDSLCLPKDQYETMTEAQIEALKDQIFENWLSIIKGEE